MDKEITKALKDISDAVTNKELTQDEAIAEVGKTIDSVVATGATLSAELTAMKASNDEAMTTLTTDMEGSVSELEAKMKAMPAFGTGVKSAVLTDVAGSTRKEATGNFIIKSVDTNVNVAGSPADTSNPIYTMAQANPFMSLATVLPTSGSTLKLPKIGGFGFTTEDTVNTNRASGGTLTSSTITLKEFVSQQGYSLPALEEVPMLDSAIVALIGQEAGASQAGDAVTSLKAGGFTSVKTGVAATIPTAANVVGKMADMLSVVKQAYAVGGRFIVSNALYGRLTQANNNGLSFNPVNGIQTLFGYPIQIVDYLEEGNTAGHKSAYFGNVGRGLVYASSVNLSVSRYTETTPGALTYFSRFHGKHAVWDDKALVSLTTAA